MRAESTAPRKAHDITAFAEAVALAARGEGNPTRPDAIQLPEHLRPTVAPDEVSYDICGRRRSPATLRSFRLGKTPPNAGKRYPAVALNDSEVMRLLKACKNSPAGRRTKALITIQWRSGLRISEALDLKRHHLDGEAFTVFVANGKGSKSRLVGMDPWAFEQVAEWIDYRYQRYPDGPIICVVQGKTKGNRWSSAAARTSYHKLADEVGLDKRFHPHALRHSLAVSLDREKHSLTTIQRTLGHSNPGITGIYLQGISNDEVVKQIAARPAPEAIA